MAYDVILVQPYPFADHPSFPEGILNRALQQAGFSVGVIETPDWHKKESFMALGRPRLFFCIISGPVDSMVLNYTSLRRRRRQDQYQFAGQAFFPGRPAGSAAKIRPDHTLIVFANRLREAYKDACLVIGGLEAGLRCFSHFDFVENKIRRSILLDSRADFLIHGWGEKQLVQLAELLRDGAEPGGIAIPGIARVLPALPAKAGTVLLPDHEAVSQDAVKLLEAQIILDDAVVSRAVVAQRHDNRFVVRFPPAAYTEDDLDRVYGLPYRRLHAHDARVSPALRMNLFSVTAHRGCHAACAFCAVRKHGGTTVLSRRRESILREIRGFKNHPLWRGVVADIGGATAEMYGRSCARSGCSRAVCLAETACPEYPGGKRFLELLRHCRRLPGVKQVFIGSGFRHDLLLREPELLEEILRFHVGEYLRIAPEHTEEHVLGLMGKPAFAVLEEFVALFRHSNSRLARKIVLRPYLIVGYPGEEAGDVQRLAGKLLALGIRELDVQVFTPSPGTLATAMFHAGRGPDLKPIPVEKNVRELQRRQRLLASLADYKANLH